MNTTVDPDVRVGDLLDVRSYVKIKTIPGGVIDECCYVDGIVFRKHVVHKKMVRAINKPRVLLLAGNIKLHNSTHTPTRTHKHKHKQAEKQTGKHTFNHEAP